MVSIAFSSDDIKVGAEGDTKYIITLGGTWPTRNIVFLRSC